ncbi:MAG: primosomal protein N', partial [Planctomycetaceae bacterium]|nr:primosomal protein N' [Planctomycetaceae bacterium]
TSPDEPAIQFAASHDYNGFASRELAHRREAGYPPYTTLARVILRGESYEEVHETAKVLSKLLRTSEAAESHPRIRILGPAPAPIARLRGQHRFHLQIAAPDVQTIASLWSETLRTFEPQADVEFTVDIDPLDMR